MANTYTKINLHLIFAVKGRESRIPPFFQPQLHSYMSGIVKNMGHIPICIGGIDNHVHLLVEFSPVQSIADFVRELKIASTKFINAQTWSMRKFGWQRGYSVFSYAPSQVEAVASYIRNQYNHHKGITLIEELRDVYEKFGVEYDEKYIFEE